jgi:hypothetical protein
MAAGKPAGVRCPQLTPDNRCKLFDNAERPQVCRSLRPTEEMCGADDAEAMERLDGWERLTRPDVRHSE